MPTPPITQTDLRNMASHIQWEFEMLCLAAEKSGMQPTTPRTNTTTSVWGTTTVTATTVGPLYVQAHQHKTLESLILEALLIHFRNLMHFLYANRQTGDLRVLPGDVIACDYVGPSWQPPSPSWLSECWQRCNRLLAHLSIDRCRYIESRTIEWRGLDEKVEHIKAVYVSFLRSLTSGREAWFQPDVPASNMSVHS
jgi:hypothetical protein